MAFSGTLRRAASRAAPVAARVFRQAPRSNNYHSSALFAAAASRTGGFSAQISRRSAPASIRCFSALALEKDQTLISVLKDEIKYAEDSTASPEAAADLPPNFPFQVEDQPGMNTVTLTRTYESEQITVEVSMPTSVTGEYDDDEDKNDDDDDTESASQNQLPLVVRVAKDGGPCLEFGCTAYPDEIIIDSLNVKDPSCPEDQIAYEGPEFSDLDENLQKAFHKYLEIRGIKPSTTNPLHEYMINKDSKEYIVWLKSLKNFVEA